MRRRTRIALLAATAVMSSAGSALAAEGDLDPSFSGDGKLLQPLAQGRIQALTVDSQSRIVAVGSVDPVGADNIDLAAARFLPNGILDPTFSGDGVATFDASGTGMGDLGSSVAVDSLGRIVVAGQTAVGDGNPLVVRFTPAGGLDLSFGGGDGIYRETIGSNDTFNGIQIDAAGRLVAGGAIGVPGSRNFLAARLTPGGVLDTTYGGGDGWEGINVNSVASNDYGENLVLDAAGRAVVVGSTELSGGDQNFAAVRFTPAGLLDPSFSNDLPTPGREITLMSSQNGTEDNDSANDVVLLPDGGYGIAGYAERAGLDQDMAVLKLTADGKLDASFSGDGKAYAAFGAGEEYGEAVAVDASGRIVIAGNAEPPSPTPDQFALTRLRADGSADTSFSGDGLVTTPVGTTDDFVRDVAIDPVTRRIVVGGFTGADDDFAIARFEAVPRCTGKIPTIAGTPGKDKLKGTKRKDVIAGGEGKDTLKGLAKADRLCGEGGKDRLLGGKGNDRLVGGKGKDNLIGGPGAKDKLKGGPGKDRERQ